jgi:hypothetical protein
MPGIDPFASITGAILDLLLRDGDLFLTLGTNLFRGVAIILIAWFGIRAALTSAEGGAALPLGPFVSLLLTIAFGFTMITYYRAPIPGLATGLAVTGAAYRWARIEAFLKKGVRSVNLGNGLYPTATLAGRLGKTQAGTAQRPLCPEVWRC